MSDRFAPDVEVAAVQAWTLMQDFVLRHDRPGDLRTELGLSPRIAGLLTDLVSRPRSLWEVALAVEVDVPMAQVIVDQLERRGLVRRHPDPNSPGATLVHLTEAGSEASASARRLLTRPPQAVTDLGPAELKALLRVLSTLNPVPESRPTARVPA